MYEAALIIFLLIMFVVTLVLMISRARMAEMKLKAGIDGDSERGKALEAIVAENQAEIAELRGRVAVLERLATDEDARVAREIEKLKRDTGKPEARS